MSDLEARVADLQAARAQGERAQIKALATVEAQSTEIERLHAQLKASAVATKSAKRKVRSGGPGKAGTPPRKRGKEAS